MDGRSISSRYDFSESDSDSVHSVQGQTARSVPLTRRYVSTVSLLSLRKKDSKLGIGNAVRSTTSKVAVGENRDGWELAEPRPGTSYLFSLGKEHDGLVEIIPETPITTRCDSENDNSRKEDDLVAIIPATPVGESDPDDVKAADTILFEQWRHSALLPLPETHRAFRPGTCASSIYSQDIRESADVDDCASSIYSQESRGTVRTRTLIPGQLHLRTRSLLSLAKKYSSPDNESICSRYECKASGSVVPDEDAPLHDDDCSIYSRDESVLSIRRRPSTRAGTMASTHSLPMPARNSWDAKPLPSLPVDRDQQSWQLPPTRDGESRKTWWSREPTALTKPLNRAKRSGSTVSEDSPGSCNQDSNFHRRPSSWSWLSIDSSLNDRASSVGSRKSLGPNMLRGQKYLRTLSLRSSGHNELATPEQMPYYPETPPPRYSKIYKLEQRLAAEARMEGTSSAAQRPPTRDGRRGAKLDPLKLPPLQLPELPDEQRVFFYAQCGHLAIDQGMIEGGPELPGWCLQCSKGRRGRRKVVKKELKSMLKSIAE